jgi:MFS family permease
VTETKSRHDSYAALRYPSFRLFVVVHWTMTLAMQLQAVVVGWQVYEITKNPLSLGLIGLAEALPFIAFALYAGNVVDRRNRKNVAALSLITLLVCSLLLLFFSLSPDRFLHGGVFPIYGVIFISGIARSFLRPAVTAFSAQLIPRAIYANAVAWRSSIWQSAAVLGPAAGGLIYGFAGLRAAYLVDVALMLVAIVALLPIRKMVVEEPATPIEDDRSFLSGLRFVLGQRVLLGAMTLDLFSVLFGGAVALLPIFADEILRVGPEGLGILRAAPAIGSVAMGIIVAHRPPFRNAGPTMLWAVAIFGMSMIGFALSRNFMVSVLLLAISGMADNISVVVRSTLLQIQTPQQMLGRVSAVNQIFIGSSNEIGMFESGVAATLLGVVRSVVFGGVMTVLVVATTAWRVPELRKLKELK